MSFLTKIINICNCKQNGAEFTAFIEILNLDLCNSEMTCNSIESQPSAKIYLQLKFNLHYTSVKKNDIIYVFNMNDEFPNDKLIPNTKINSEMIIMIEDQQYSGGYSGIISLNLDLPEGKYVLLYLRPYKKHDEQKTNWKILGNSPQFLIDILENQSFVSSPQESAIKSKKQYDNILSNIKQEDEELDISSIDRQAFPIKNQQNDNLDSFIQYEIQIKNEMCSTQDLLGDQNKTHQFSTTKKINKLLQSESEDNSNSFIYSNFKKEQELQLSSSMDSIIYEQIFKNITPQQNGQFCKENLFPKQKQQQSHQKVITLQSSNNNSKNTHQPQYNFTQSFMLSNPLQNKFHNVNFKKTNQQKISQQQNKENLSQIEEIKQKIHSKQESIQIQKQMHYYQPNLIISEIDNESDYSIQTKNKLKI